MRLDLGTAVLYGTVMVVDDFAIVREAMEARIIARTLSPSDIDWLVESLETLEAENTRLREALAKLADDMEDWRNRNPNARLSKWPIEQARAALSGEDT